MMQKQTFSFLHFCTLYYSCLFTFRAKWNTFISVSAQLFIAVYMIQREIRLIAGVISLRSFWQKMNFVSGDKISCKHYRKWNHIKQNICTCIYFIKTKMLGFNWIGSFSWITPAKFHFLSYAMKSSLNTISFTVGWNFILGRFSGLMQTPSKITRMFEHLL